MIELNTVSIPTNGEPVTEQAPKAVADTLPANYLDEGYYSITEKGATYLKPVYVDSYAKEIARSLGMRPSDFNSLLRGLKSAKKRTLPFEARKTALAEMLPKSLALVRRKKAPALLVDFVQANLQAIHTDDDYNGFFRHAEAISGFLTMQSDTDTP